MRGWPHLARSPHRSGDRRGWGCCLTHLVVALLLAGAPLKLSDVLAEVEARSPVLLADQARKDSLLRAADGTGWWDEPFLAVGPDEVSLSEPMPVVRAQLSQLIPFPGKRSARAAALTEQADAARAANGATLRGLRVAATQVFLRALFVRQALATNALLQQAVREVQASAAARYTSGSGGHHDALLAGAELAVLERDALALDRSLRGALVALDELRGRAPTTEPEFPELVDDVTPAVAASFEDAVAAQPELAAADARVRAAEADERARSLAAWPDMTVQLMWMQSFMAEEPSNAGAMVGVSVPLFAPWKQGALTDSARLLAAAEQRDVEALRLRLRAEWEQAQLELRTATETRALYVDKILPATKLALESSETAYAAREAPLVELLSVIRAWHQVSLESEAARLDVRLASLRLAELLSQPAVMRLAPTTPTLFGAGAGGMGGMSSMPSMGAAGAMPARMGAGMAAPAPGLVVGDEGAGGMSGMGGM